MVRKTAFGARAGVKGSAGTLLGEPVSGGAVLFMVR